MELLERSALMTAHEEPAWERTRLRVPREDGTFLIEPVPSAIREQIASVHDAASTFANSDAAILGCAVDEFRRSARQDVINAAVEWTSGLLGQDVDLPATSPLIMTGHQPELFHPGVLAKNVAASELSAQAGGIGLNLVVDNDLMSSTRVRIPVGERAKPHVSTIEFDEPRPQLPWEVARVANPSLLESFGDRVADAMSGWGIEPLIKELWPAVVQRARQGATRTEGASLAECFTAGGATLERAWGLGNLELPISRLCESDAFRSFAAHIFLHAEEFRSVYNTVLTEYREVNHIRSSSHPVPELQARNGWCETPFWIWKTSDARRGRVFVRQLSNELQLATAPDEAAKICSLSLVSGIETGDAVTAMRQLEQCGLRLRTRALTTTLFTRLCLCDLFIHGIGGAKYDAMTDRIASRFFGVCLPGFVTLSATAWLPLGETWRETAADVSRLRQMLWELRHNSQRHLPTDLPEEVRQLVVEKDTLIAGQKAASRPISQNGSPSSDVQRGVQRYRRFPVINQTLAKCTQNQQDEIHDELAQVEHRLAANSILKSREFSFCLYPAERIHGMVHDLRKLLAAP